MVKWRWCPDCESVHPATTEFFYRNNARKDGLDTYCKPCRRARRRFRYKSKGEELRAKQRRYYSLHRDKELERGRQFREANPEYMREHYRENRAQRLEYKSDYQDAEKSLRTSFQPKNNAPTP